MNATLKFIDPHKDQWHAVVADDSDIAVPAHVPYSIISLAQWETVRGCWPQGMPLGLAVPNDTDIETLEADLPRFSCIALDFPKWVDGRAYSQAHLLRSRYRFTGEIRATGEVLVDMMPLLRRTGFDAVVLRHDQDKAAAERALTFFPDHYQGDVLEHRPRFVRAPAQ
ncbi:MAG: hypothetical protein JWP52_3829 [Rhizobacter sp.]|nr:hypothetical protein [Rhizobacter sp.]